MKLFKVILKDTYPNGKNIVRWTNCNNESEIIKHFSKHNIKSVKEFK